MGNVNSKRSGYILQIKFLLFSASIVPGLLIGVLGLYEQNISILNWGLIILGLFLGQAGADYLYYYFTNNHSDSRDTHTKVFAGWRPLFASYFKKQNTSFIVGLLILAASLLIVYYFYVTTGWKILAFAIAGGAIAVFFTFLMLRGLKEITVFIVFGPLSILGGYLALTGELSYVALLVSIPVGLLIALVAYLKGAKIQTSSDDNRVININLKTIDTLIAGAFGALVLLVITHVIPWLSITGLIGLLPLISMRKKLTGQTASIPVYLRATVQSILAMIITSAGIMLGLIVPYFQ